MMTATPDDTIWAEVAAELAHWSEARQSVRFWLRDDDASDVTAALDRFVALICAYRVPAVLAIIPALMTGPLVAFVRDQPLLLPATHGLKHLNHAGPDDKKIELGGARPLEAVLGDLRQGRALIAEAFGPRAPDMLVPPWNRISVPVAAHLQAIGFDVLSVYGWKPDLGAIGHLNTHVDMIDWKADRRGKTLARLATEIAASLRQARGHGFAPVGLLTHHLDHDETAWDGLAAIFEWTAARPEIKWCTPAGLLVRRTGGQVSL